MKLFKDLNEGKSYTTLQYDGECVGGVGKAFVGMRSEVNKIECHQNAGTVGNDDIRYRW